MNPKVALSNTQAFRDEHAALLVHIENLRAVAARIPEMNPTERGDAIRPILEFLRGTLIPHAEAEERVLYPAVADILGDPRATATMISDHGAIVARIEELEAAAPADAAHLQGLLYGLYALLLVHFQKEEDDYLPLLESQPPGQVQRIMERMGEHGHAHGH
jgi:iron-sulfur cluster repair protein YtfE (RIC family)